MNILDSCKVGGLGPSRLVSCVNFNYNVLKNKYLPVLIDLGHLEVVPAKGFRRNSRVLYRTTSLGLMLLGKYKEVEQAVLRFELYEDKQTPLYHSLRHG
jgi:predicted transcriptional regulator